MDKNQSIPEETLAAGLNPNMPFGKVNGESTC